MTDRLPESNADQVALNLVVTAIVDEVTTPGESVAKLFDRMAAMSRDIGGDFRAATADWQGVLDNWDESEAKPLVNRQAQAMGDTWAKCWLLCQMVKRLHEDLERSCHEHPAASKIERVTYGHNGTLESWALRRDL
jgi:hypothetical protein